jgi:hypothetical protein
MAFAVASIEEGRRGQEFSPLLLVLLLRQPRGVNGFLAIS